MVINKFIYYFQNLLENIKYTFFENNKLFLSFLAYFMELDRSLLISIIVSINLSPYIIINYILLIFNNNNELKLI